MANDIQNILRSGLPTGYTGSRGGGQNGSTTTSTSSNLTLTVSSSFIQLVTLTATEKYVILPDATTLVAGNAWIIKNQGTIPFGVQDNAGNMLAVVEGGDIVIFWCTSVSTAAGVWIVSSESPDGMLGRILVHTATSLGTLYSDTISVDVLSSTKTIVGYTDSSTNKATVVILSISGTTISVGTPATVGSAASGAVQASKIIVLSASQAMFVYNVSSKPTACIINISGTTCTPATELQIYASATGAMDSCLLSATSVLIVYQQGSILFANVLTVSGSTITKHTDYTFTHNSTVPVLLPLSSTSVFCAFTDTTSSVLNGVILSISSTTVTVNTFYNFPNTSGSSTCLAGCVLSSTLVAVMFNDSSGRFAVTLVSISGTTITFNPYYPYYPLFLIYADAAGMATISSTRFAIQYINDFTNQRLYAQVFDIVNGTIIRESSRTSLISSDSSSIISNKNVLGVLSSNALISIIQDSTTSTNLGVVLEIGNG